MSHWFHRNPIKSTNKISLDTKLSCTNTAARQIASDTSLKRNKLLDILCDPNLSIAILNEAATQYLSHLRGFVNEPDQGTASSKLRHAMAFKWTNTLHLKNDAPLQQADFQFELVSILFNIGMWYTKHAAKLSSTESVDMETAKEVHKCLRTAAGIFQDIKDNQIGSLLEKGADASDLDERVIDAYINQSSAEAQEVTMARAIEMEHSASIVAALAHDTARMFRVAEVALNTLEDQRVAKWRRYLTFKMKCYMAYSYSYHGADLLKQDKCGEAIASLRESTKHYAEAEKAAALYNKTPGPGLTVSPEQHLFFRKLGPHVRVTLEKCQRENGFIYHQEVPSEIAELELRATFGLAAPEPFKMPELHKSWTPDAYKGFDLSPSLVAPKAVGAKDKKDEKEAPVELAKEKPIYESQKDPKNNSGCIIS